MRFAVVLVSGLAAAVSAQTTAVAADPATVTCLKKCPVGDVNCQSHCIAVPNPNEQQVNDTTKCTAACPKGKGSAEETQKYADCVQGCISKHYFVSSQGTPQATGGSGDSGGDGGGNTSAAAPSQAPATANGTGAAPTTSANSGSGSGSGSGADAGASQTPGSTSGSKTSSSAAATSTNAAPGVTFGATGALVGALAALFAL